MKKIILIICLILFGVGVFGQEKSVNIDELITKLNQNYSHTTLKEIHKNFLMKKGIYDKLLAYTLFDIALKNKSNFTLDDLQIISNFYPQDKQVFENLKSKSFNIGLLKIYIDKFLIYTISYYISLFVLLLLLIYLFIKNFGLFTHTHSEKDRTLAVGKVAVGVILYVLAILIFPSYILQITIIGILILVSFEKIKVKIIIFIFILFFSLLSTLNFKSITNNNPYPNNLAVSPLSKLDKTTPTNLNEQLILCLKANKFCDIDIDQYNPQETSGIINKISFYLKNGESDKAINMINTHNLSDNPIIIYNLAVYSSLNFKLDLYDQLISQLQQNSFLYSLFDFYQKEKMLYYLPYFKFEKNEKKYTLYFDTNNLLITLGSLLIGVILNFLIGRLKVFRCSICGEVYCAKCDEGFLRNNICEKCKKFNDSTISADASELVKHKSLIEYNETKRKKLVLFANLLLPGCGSLIRNKTVISLLTILLFSINLYLLIFKYIFIATDYHIGFQFIFFPIYMFFIVIFLIFYLVNLFMVE